MRTGCHPELVLPPVLLVLLVLSEAEGSIAEGSVAEGSVAEGPAKDLVVEALDY